MVGCRGEAVVLQPGETQVTSGVSGGKYRGFYLLNEGNMGSNKATLDRFDYSTGIYTLNIYAATNPHVVSELGDVGNDLQVYGSKLYAVINCSNLVEVMDLRTAAHLGTIEIPNCRYITFHGGKAYVSSYAGPVQINPEHEQLGYIAEIDTATLKITRKVTVGYQPEEMAIVGGKLYVANSGGYYPPRYDRTLSVVDINTFTEIKKVDIAINIHRVRKDAYGDLYISCRGDYYDKVSKLYVFDTRTETLKDSIDIPVSDFCINGDTAYIFSNDWKAKGSKGTITYSRLNVLTEQPIDGNFIDADVAANIKCPYGIAVNPETGEIFLCDAKSYVIPGTLYCLDGTGHERWHVTTGDIPAHIVFFK